MTMRFVLTATASALAVAAAGAVAAPLTPQAKTAAALAALKARMQDEHPAAQRPAGNPAQRADGEYDITPPTLAAFSLDTTHVNARKTYAQAIMRFAARDNQVGVSSVSVYLTGLDGQLGTGASSQLRYDGPRRWSGELAWVPDVSTPPGVWTIAQVSVTDWNGNNTTYDTAALAAMGSATQIRVHNVVYDRTPPQAVRGVIKTPTLSVSQPRPGAAWYTQPARLTLKATDSGQGGTSGVRSSQAQFCTETGQDCFWLYSTSQTVAGKTASEDTLAAFWGLNARSVGTYHLHSLYVFDFAGNYQYLWSTQFGGDTDFSTLFPGGTTITLTP